MKVEILIKVGVYLTVGLKSSRCGGTHHCCCWQGTPRKIKWHTGIYCEP